MKPIRTFLPLILLLGSVPLLQAQGSFDVAIGFGSVHDKATGLGIENASSLNAFGSCTPSSADPTCEATPGLGGLLMGFEGDGMLNKHIGIGGELSFQPTKGNYGPLQYRQIFYTFNGIYAPINNKRLDYGWKAELAARDRAFHIQRLLAWAPQSARRRPRPWAIQAISRCIWEPAFSSM